MKKQFTIALFIAVLLGVYQTGCADGQGEQEGSGTKTTMQTTKFEDAQGDCTNGGVKIEVLVDGTVDNTQTQYLCNGIQGQGGINNSIRTTAFDDAQGDCTNGGVKIEVLVDGTVDNTQTQYICNGINGQGEQNGTNTSIQTTKFEDAQGDCTNGGVKIEVLVDGVVDDTQTQYLCNGAQGLAGSSTNIQATPFEDAQGECANGGVKIEFLVDGTVDDTQTQYICHGVNGHDGKDGQNSYQALVMTSNDVGANCTHGGIRIDSGVDKNNNNTLETSEILSTRYVCNGANGANGQDGTNGTNGTNASIQTTPFVGAQGSCTNGGVKVEVLMDGVVQAGQTQYLCNGANGADGLDGQNGADGQNGHNALVATSNENAGTNCAHGGIRIDSGVDKNNNNTLETSEILSTRYVCNGANGVDGQDGQDGTNGTNGTNASIQTTTFVGALGSCTNGGVKVEVLVDGVVQTGQTQYLCNGVNGADGQDGQNGADGQNGHNALVATSNENAGANCTHGGIRIDSGVDINNNNTLETSEILSTRYVCNGANGADGQDGTNGTNGTNASIQTTPFDGAQGSCTNGGVKIEVLVDGVVQAGQTQYLCNGAGSSGVCLTDNDCRETAYCDQMTLMCVDKKAPGESCTQSNQCLGGCLDNVCIGIGDVITFGHYEQDNDTTNGQEPIEWRVLDINDEGQLLVISEKVLDVQKTPVDNWENSAIRSWLNGYVNFTSNNFIDAAFTAEEKAKIVASNVPAHVVTSDTTQGNATTDKIFLLSTFEATTYFTGSADRRADATRYAVKKGVWVIGSESGKYSSDGTCADVHCYAYWWLRTNYSTSVYSIQPDGSFHDYSNSSDLRGVRPALWLKY